MTSFPDTPGLLVEGARLTLGGTPILRGVSLEMARGKFVVLPKDWPAATAFVIFSVVAHWNAPLWPLIVVTGIAWEGKIIGWVEHESHGDGTHVARLRAIPEWPLHDIGESTQAYGPMAPL